MTLKNIFISLFILLFCFSMQAQHEALKQKISIEKTDATLSEIIEAISESSGLNFAFNSQKVNAGRIFSFKAEEMELATVLDELCSLSSLEYKLIENQIVLKRAKGFPSDNFLKPKTFTISGFVKDNETGESLIGSTIYTSDIAYGTTTNAYGFYSLSLPEGDYDIVFSYIGYMGEQQHIQLDKDLNLHFNPEINKQLLTPVIVTTQEEDEKLQSAQMNQMKMYPSQLKTMPEFGGEVGLVKSLQSLPGIKTHSDGSSFFFVRGGNRDQNLILIDEAPIFNAAHLFGYYSIIVPEVTKEIKIYKGDMPVSQGDRISSVIDIKTKDGNMKQLEFNGTLNPLVNRFSVEGPIKKDKHSFYTSFRHSNFRWLYKRSVPDLDIHFSDFTSKLNFTLNQKNRIYLTFFYGNDNVTTDNNQGGVQWENFTYTLRWNHIFGQRLFSNAMIYFSSYQYDFFVLNSNIKWTSAIETMNFKYDFTYFASPKTTIKFGFLQGAHEINPGNLDNESITDVLSLGVSPRHSNKTALYFSREHQVSEKFSFKAGFRIPIWINYGPTTIYTYNDNFNVEDTISIESEQPYKSYVNFDPRLSFKYRVGKRSSFNLSLGRSHQYLQVLSSSVSPFTPLEVWLPAGINIKPQRADQLSLGYNQFMGKTTEMNIEAYYKQMENQIDYEPHPDLLLNPYIEGELRFGSARSYGIEVMIHKRQGRLSGWINYTLSKTLQKVDAFNNGAEYPAFYDRPHDLNVFISYQLLRLVNLSANWVYYTGSAITTPIGFYNYNGYTVPLYDTKNNDRLPDYHRLDVSMNFRLNRSDRKFEHRLIFGIYNLYNRHNPISVNFNKVKTKNGKFVVPADHYGNTTIYNTEKYVMGIMPSITYKIRL